MAHSLPYDTGFLDRSTRERPRIPVFRPFSIKQPRGIAIGISLETLRPEVCSVGKCRGQAAAETAAGYIVYCRRRRLQGRSVAGESQGLMGVHRGLLLGSGESRASPRADPAERTLGLLPRTFTQGCCMGAGSRGHPLALTPPKGPWVYCRGRSPRVVAWERGVDLILSR